MEALAKIPDRITAGTTVKYTRSWGDYPANQGWTAKLALHVGAIKQIYDAVVSADGASFDFTLPAAGSPSTAELTAGNCRWFEQVTNGAEVYEPASGVIEVRADPMAAAGGSFQSWAERTLAVIEAKLEGRATEDIESYQIAGRAVSRIPERELLQIRSQLVQIVRAERQKGRFGQTVRLTMQAPQ